MKTPTVDFTENISPERDTALVDLETLNKLVLNLSKANVDIIVNVFIDKLSQIEFTGIDHFRNILNDESAFYSTCEAIESHQDNTLKKTKSQI